MFVRVLGSAAGGGFPQWNCNCGTCRSAREEPELAHPRLQSSLAIAARGGPTYLVNASPDVRQQLEGLGRVSGPRSSPIAGVLLTDAEIDHTLGLLVLREAAAPLDVWGTPEVRGALTDGFPALRMLERYSGLQWHDLTRGETQALPGGSDLPGLHVEAFPVLADAPKYLDGDTASTSASFDTPGESARWAVGLTFRDPASGGVATYVPAVASMDDALVARFAESDCVLVDGTFWADDELLTLGVGKRTGREMGHLPLNGPGGSLEALARLPRPRKILVHINNTNPVLREDSPERRAVEAAGVEVGDDGLEVEL